MILCITGMPGSGKSVVADVLKKMGFRVFEMSSVVKDMMAEKGLEINVVSLDEFATNLRKRRGNDVVAVELAKKIRIHGKKTGEKRIAIAGLRSMQEFRYLKKYIKKIVIVAIIAPQKLRYERLHHRKLHRIKSFNEFVFREKKTKSFGMDAAIKNADYVIYNNGSVRQLKKSVEQLVEYIGI